MTDRTGLPPEVRTTDILAGHVWGIVGPGRACYAVSVAEVARMADRAASDNRGMYEDPDEAIEAVTAAIKASITDMLSPGE